MGMRIRRARAEDFERMRAITHRALREIAIRRYRREDVDKAIAENAWTLQRDLLVDGHYYVAVENDEIAGGIGWDERDLGQTSTPHQPPSRCASLRGLYVDPDHTGQRIGSSLLRHCLDDIAANGLEVVELFASHVAESLFARFGFTVVAEQELVLSDGTRLPGRRMQLCFAKQVAE